MCGICGVARPSGRVTAADDASVRRMVAMLGHRGPDGDGSWSGGRVLFGHTRLSIIDIAGGHQPMFNETGDVAVTFNGEIYNFVELRTRLVAAGHQFRTHSDTEVVVHGYEQWGDDVVSQLRGMFAFAVWDARRERLLLARDRFGEKPLYYHVPAPGELIFASEVKALLAHPQVPRAVNAERVPEYLTFRSVAGAETLFRGVLELPPASTMVVDARGTTIRPYWTPVRDIVEPAESPVAHGRALLAESVRLRLMSDVAIGTITSGGLDSSLVSAIAMQEAGRPLDTFCVGFDDPAYDERPYARAMSEHIGARFHEIEVSAADIERELDPLTWAHDEPLTHPNSIPMHLLFRYAKEEVGITVLLSGEGADELFGGYGRYRIAHQRHQLRRLGAVRRLLPPVGRLRALRDVLAPGYLLAANAVTAPGEVAMLAHPAADVFAQRRPFWRTDRPPLDALFLYDQATYLPPLLQRQDRMSMAAGVEARVVFLDHALVEWGNALPAAAKVAAGEPKRLLKELAEPWVPMEIVQRRKVGFTLPLGRWLREGGPLARRLDRLRAGSAFVRGLVDGRRLDALLRAHAGGSDADVDLLWSLVALESWAEVFLGAGLHTYTLPGAVRPAAVP